jgi:hypothetical protein
MRSEFSSKCKVEKSIIKKMWGITTKKYKVKNGFYILIILKKSWCKLLIKSQHP